MRSYYKLEIPLCILGLIYTDVVFSMNSFQQYTQWIKITSTLNNIDFKLTATELESSHIDCGEDCGIIKLGTTPFSDEGTFTIFLKEHPCGARGSIDLPFILKDGHLTTSVKKYKIKVESTYCGSYTVNLDVFGDPYSVKGYSMNLYY